MSKSVDLRLTYLWQFKWYPLPLIPLPLKTTSQLCQSPQPSLPKYNPVPLLEEQVCQEEAEAVCQEEEVHLEEVEEAHLEEEMLTNLPKEMENPWAHYQWSLKEITQRLRVSSENSPPTFSSTMMSQHLPPLSKELPLPSLASKDQRSTNGCNSNSNGWWCYNQQTTPIPHTNNSSWTFMLISWILKRPKEQGSNCKH